ncbi:MAG: prepilin-type N-terminal cleavage/methylation domain-containing protein [Actinobacteria bacterium]|nr:prepilin-type N-terminal cleavage/methylation domain-containing protein [Actinomycetota bacterium]
MMRSPVTVRRAFSLIELLLSVFILAIGIISVWWGLQGGGPALAFQGPRDLPVTGILRIGGSVSTRDGAVSWGAGLLAASFVRLTRP